MSVLQDVKTLLNITDTDQDTVLNLIISISEKQFRVYTKLDVIPPDLDFIIIEVAVIRFNRIGNEGMKSNSVEGHNVVYDTDDFNYYAHFLQDYIDDHDDEDNHRERGKVVAL